MNIVKIISLSIAILVLWAIVKTGSKLLARKPGIYRIKVNGFDQKEAAYWDGFFWYWSYPSPDSIFDPSGREIPKGEMPKLEVTFLECPDFVEPGEYPDLSADYEAWHERVAGLNPVTKTTLERYKQLPDEESDKILYEKGREAIVAIANHYRDLEKEEEDRDNYLTAEIGAKRKELEWKAQFLDQFTGGNKKYWEIHAKDYGITYIKQKSKAQLIAEIQEKAWQQYLEDPDEYDSLQGDK
jgi:hypothetical protein